MFNSKTIVVILIAILSFVAINICEHLNKFHSGASAEEIAGGFWGDVCTSETNTKVDCAKVVKSEYGVIDIPWLVGATRESKDQDGKTVNRPFTTRGKIRVPVSLLGECYYLFMLIWFVTTGVPRREYRRWHLLPAILTVGAACGSIYFVYIMASKLDAWCRLCFILHGVDFVLLGTVIYLWPRQGPDTVKGKESRRANSSDKAAKYCAECGENLGLTGKRISFRHWFATVGFIVAGCAVVFSQFHGQVLAAQTQAWKDWATDTVKKTQDKSLDLLLQAFVGTKPVEFPVREGLCVSGNPQAKHEMVIFSDLQCPVCKKFEVYFREKSYPLWGDNLKIVFRHFPLCTECNPSNKPSEKSPLGTHPHACQAAYAAEAARIQGGSEAFWKMHDVIFTHQDEFNNKDFKDERFIDFAREINLDVEKFQKDFSGEAVRKVVVEDIALGLKLKINSTPTVFLDGRKLFNEQRAADAFWEVLAKNANKSQPRAPEQLDEQGNQQSTEESGQSGP